MQLSHTTLKTIGKSINNYFEKQGLGEVKIQPPYLGEMGSLPALDYSGLIQIYGAFHGAVYFSAKASLLSKVLSRLGQTVDNETLLDVAGEMSNIFAGNIREDLGGEFEISTPFTMHGPLNSINFRANDKPYILPIVFEGETSILVIYFEKK